MSQKSNRTDRLKQAVGKSDKSNKHITKISAKPSTHSEPAKPSEDTSIAKISAKSAKAKTTKSSQKVKKTKNPAVKNPLANPNEKPLKEVFVLARPFVAAGRYVRDSWRELRQVRWPNRKATWKMTFAVLLYSVMIMIFVLLLDTFFTFLFNLLLTK